MARIEIKKLVVSFATQTPLHNLQIVEVGHLLVEKEKVEENRVLWKIEKSFLYSTCPCA